MVDLQAIQDGAHGWAAGLARCGLAALAVPYGAAVALRDGTFAAGWREVTRLPVPVVSVGNLAAGGTGKTPLVLFLAQALTAAGRRPGILARGYRREPGERLNDEGRELEAVLGSAVPQEQRPDRAAAGRALLAAHPQVDLLLLDDGFQHRQLARDLDIVLLDAGRALGGERLLPRGRLREPPSALARADLVVGTHADRVTPARRLAFALEVARWTSAPVVLAGTRVVRVRGTADPDPAALFGLPVAIACGVAHPGGVRRTVEDLGAQVRWLEAFADHRAPPPEAFRALRRRASAAGARLLLVTRKDAMKLGPLCAEAGPVPVGILEIEVRILEGADVLDRALHAAGRAALAADGRPA